MCNTLFVSVIESRLQSCISLLLMLAVVVVGLTLILYVYVVKILILLFLLLLMVPIVKLYRGEKYYKIIEFIA